MNDQCAHIPAEVPAVAARTDGCEDCLRIGSSWVHLRMCVTCGHVGCCDQSEHHHARQHYEAHPGHVLLRSFEPGEAWWYCWVDDLAFELDGFNALRAD
ncbi:MAG: UBP-type zinc finger domain-containing protein [Acidimicrobiia bacterium]|nr:UBP-type zinc finger domain-containing protein [Acidimicrobiia bacterium]